MLQLFSRSGISEHMLLKARDAFDELALALGRRALCDLDEREESVIRVIAESGGLVPSWCGGTQAEELLDGVVDGGVRLLNERVEDPPLGVFSQLSGIVLSGALLGLPRLFGA